MRMLLLRLVIVAATATAAAAFGTPKAFGVSRAVALQSSISDNEVAVNVPAKKAVIMSEAIPFLKCPPVLAESTLAGNVGFDPMGFARTQDDLLLFREAEIKHARLAMLASAGWPLSEVYDRQIADALGLPAILDLQDRVPSVLNGSMDSVSPTFWGACVGMTAAIDTYGISKARQEDSTYFPGNLSFDPLGLYPSDRAGRARMELAEIKHGRLAMFAITGFAAQEYVTKIGVVDETPMFFFPLGNAF